MAAIHARLMMPTTMSTTISPQQHATQNAACEHVNEEIGPARNVLGGHTGAVTDVVSFRLWPPVAVGAPLVVGEVVTLVAGDPVDPPGARVPVGLVLAAVFVIWNGWSLMLFRRHRTGLLPGQATRTMLDEGPFARSRNPLYLGMLVLYVALGLLLPTFWGLVLTPVAVVLVEWGAIRPEERFLRERFGSTYEEYAGRVRRWL